MGIAAVGGDVGEATAALGVAVSSPSLHAVTNAMPRKSSTMASILKA
jgi:hypothetical protein